MITATLTPAQSYAQAAAELLWSAATCEDHAVASSQAEPYRTADAAFAAALAAAYPGLSGAELRRVRELLTELGPREWARDADAPGVAGFAQVAPGFVAEGQAEEAEHATHMAIEATGPQDEWDVYRHGQRIATVYLADSQVGHYFRQLPGGVSAGWGFRPAADGPAPDDLADASELSRIESSAGTR
jgi:hypothetical protein